VDVVVVGAGAWGLPTAAELLRRGHAVTLVDRHRPGNHLSSSGGPTRLWRVADPDPAAIRLGRRAVSAMERLESRLGRPLRTRPGLLWRDAEPALRQIADAVAAEGVTHTEVPAASVADLFPGLRPDGRDALWFPEAGALLAAEAVAGYVELVDRDEGVSLFGRGVSSVSPSSSGADVTLADGEVLHADAVVVCAGPGTPALLPGMGLEVPLRSFLEQVVHLGDAAGSAAYDDLPCLFDGPTAEGAGVYTMATPGVGYKIGIDDPLRELPPGDDDRTPDPERTRAILAWAARSLTSIGTDVVDELVCCWTDSPDGWFVVDVVGPVVVACGDSGKGFKYSPAMGEILADLVEGEPVSADVAAMSASRFAGYDGTTWTPTSLGSVQS
jgi:glycine/D-amino acid oxidase-like deaminating enzyme